MAWLLTLLVVETLCGVHTVTSDKRAASAGPGDGFLNSFTARYRYPVYVAKRESGEQDASDEDPVDPALLVPFADLGKRRPHEYDLSSLSRMLDSGKKRSAMPLSELTPHFPTYTQLFEAGKRSPMDTLYDLPTAHRLFQIGKRNYHSLDLNSLENLLQAGKRGYTDWDLGSTNRMMEAGKRSYTDWDLGSINRMMEAGKRSYNGLDFNTIDRLMQAGKRSYEGLDLSAIRRLYEAGKRSYQGIDLEPINRLMQAGKRRYGGLDLNPLQRLLEAGKRSYEENSAEGPFNLGQLSEEVKVTDDNKNGVSHDIPLDVEFWDKAYNPEKRSNLLTRNIRPSLYDIRDMSRILQVGKKRNAEDTRTKRRVTDVSKRLPGSEPEENHTKDGSEDKSNGEHERAKRSVQWQDVFGIDRKKRGVDWSTVFGIDKKKRSGSWSDVFGIDRKKRSWDDYFGYDKKSNELQDELFDDLLAKQYLQNFNNFILRKADDDDEEGYGRAGLAPPQVFGRL